MKRTTIAMLAIAGVLIASVPASRADDTAQSKQARVAELAKKAIVSPDDLNTFNQYMSAALTEIGGLMSSNPEAAKAKVEELKKTLSQIKPTSANGKTLLARAKSAANSYATQVEAAAAKLEDLLAKVKKDPNDVHAIGLLRTKLMREVASNARSNPDAAEKALNLARKVFGEIEKNATDDNAKRLASSAVRTLDRYEASIEAGRKLTELIGKPMIPLTGVEAWVNGGPLTAEDLKGKVVLLDFWAVWCGPCIATFPHLREWHEKYGDKGLEIVGVTRYYNYDWDDAKKRAVRTPAQLSHAREQVMLEKFLAHHQLKHPIAVTTDSETSKAYGVTGIPHVVLIDRDGKIRLIRVGSGEKNAHDIEEMIKKLIGDKA